MHVLTRSRLKAFWTEHPDAKGQLQAWFAEVRKVDWKSPQDVVNHLQTARPIGKDRVIFNIKGNDYRLVTAVDYRRGKVFIKFIGTHAEYDKIDALTVK